MRRHPAWSVGIGSTLSLLIRLFAGGAVGLADNLDGHRLLCQLGVAPHPFSEHQPLWAFTTPRYDAYTWWGEACSAGGSGRPQLSTEYFPLWIAKQLTGLLGLPGALDLRLLGPLFAVAAGAAIGWTAHLLPGPVWARVLTASGLGLATADSAVALYFASPYPDPAVLIGLLALIPALLNLLRRPAVRFRDVLLVVAVGAWTIGADIRAAGILAAVVPVLLLRPWRYRAARPGRPTRPDRPTRETRPTRFGRVVRGVLLRIPAAAAAGLLILGTGAWYRAQPSWPREIARYNAVFGQILGHSADPARAARDLGLPPALASAAGSTLVSPNSAAQQSGYRAFLAHDGFSTIAGYYAEHPLRLFGLADRGLVDVTTARPDYLGTYPSSAGHQPYAKECRVCVAEAVFTLAAPVRWLVFPLLWGGAIALGALVSRRGRRAMDRAAGVVLAAVAVVTVTEFWIVMVFQGGADAARDMAPVIFGTLLLGPLAVAALAGFDYHGPRDDASPAGEGAEPAAASGPADAPAGELVEAAA